MVKVFVAEPESRITSEMFINTILICCLGIQDEKLAIARNEYGKPVLTDYPDIHYNISHTRGMIVCAVSDSPIGIDVERIRSFSNRIPERFFTKNEREYVFLENEGQEIRFFEVWTKKEAYVKWLGKGITVPLASFDVIKDDRINTVHINGYVVSICSEIVDEINADKFIKIEL